MIYPQVGRALRAPTREPETAGIRLPALPTSYIANWKKSAREVFAGAHSFYSENDSVVTASS